MSCFRYIRFCWDGFGFANSNHHLKELPKVVLDTSKMGNNVVIVKNGQRICGCGGALTNVPIVQNKAYFEVKIQQTGVWCVGLATEAANLNTYNPGQDQASWVLCHDATIKHNKRVIHKLSEVPQEGDIIGVTYDHIEMNFYLNGSLLQCPITGIKGTIYPFLYVDDSSILDAYFMEFVQKPPLGFDRIMVEQSLL